ncbi:MAG: transposase [Opitutaceae bacterium]
MLADHFETLTRVHEERYEPTHGPLRPVVSEVVGKFLDCGLLEHGFARVRCAACRAEFLVAFRCKGRGFCPSCQARRLAEWSLWLDEHLLAPVVHRHVVLTIPKRLRAYFLYDRRRLGLLSRVASRTLHAYVRASLGERDAVPGVVSLTQSFGSLAHWHPHLHLVVTDGAFRRDGSFVTQFVHDASVLAEAWRRAVLALFVREGWLEDAAAAAMLTWPHSGFSAYVGPAIAAEDRAAVLRVARYGACAPVAESRLRYDAERAEVELAADASEGPYAGVHRMAALEFLARLVDHIPAKGEVRTRYYGAYASRRRGWWRRRRVVLVGAGRGA